MSAATQSKQELNNPDQDLNTSSNGATQEVAPVEQKQILSELGAKALKLMKVVTSFDPTAVIKELHVSFDVLKKEMSSSYLKAQPGSAEQQEIAIQIAKAKDLFVNDEVLKKSRELVSSDHKHQSDLLDSITQLRNKINDTVPNAINEEVKTRDSLIEQQQQIDLFDPSVDSLHLSTSIADLNQRIKDLEEGNYDEALKESIKDDEALLDTLLKAYTRNQRAVETAQKTLNGLIAEHNPDLLSQEDHGKILTAVANTKGPHLVNLLVGGAIDPEAASAGLDILNYAMTTAVQERKIELISNIEDSFESGDLKSASSLLGKAVNLIRRVGDSVSQISNLELPAIIAPKFWPAIGNKVTEGSITAADAVERIAAIAQADPIAAEEVLHEISRQNIANLKDSISQAIDTDTAIKLTEMLQSAIHEKPVSRAAKTESLKEQMTLLESEFDAAEKEVFGITHEKALIEDALNTVVADEIKIWSDLVCELVDDRNLLVKQLDEDTLDGSIISQIERRNKEIQFYESYINELSEGKHDASLSEDLYKNLETANEMLSASLDAAQEIADKYASLEASLNSLESSSVDSLRVDVIAKARTLFENFEKQIQEGGPDSLLSVVNIAKTDLNESYNQLLVNAAEALTEGKLSTAQRIIKSALRIQERFPEAVGEEIIQVHSMPQLVEDPGVEEVVSSDSDKDGGSIDLNDSIVETTASNVTGKVAEPTDKAEEPLSSPLETDVKATVAPASDGAEEVSAPLEEEQVVKKRGFLGSWFDKVRGNGSVESPVESPEKM
jgi:hypothetical protein